jgi:hypothetical protein
MSMLDDFERVLCGQGARGLYESNYLKANDPSGEGAFWIKYNLMAPTSPEFPRHGEIWAILWSGAGKRPTVVKQVIPETLIQTSDQRLELDLSAASLEPGRARGAVEDGRHRIAWDLSLCEGGQPIYHLPYPALYRIGFPKKKIMTPRPRQVFRGQIEIDDRVIAVDGWVGLRGHNWGSEHAHSYAYGNANLWDQPAEWAYDAFSARIRLGVALSPWLSAAVLQLPKGELRCNQPWKWANRTARVGFPSWKVSFTHPTGYIRTRWTLDPEDVAGLRYLHPDGHVSYCYNTKFAHLELDLKRGPHRTRRTSSKAELEFLTPSPIPGIPLHGNDMF